MLQKLAQRGVSVRVLGSFCFDSMAGAKSHFPKLEEEMKESSKKSALNFNQNGIDYTYLPCASINMGEMTHDESWKLFSRFCSMLMIAICFLPIAMQMHTFMVCAID